MLKASIIITFLLSCTINAQAMYDPSIIENRFMFCTGDASETSFEVPVQVETLVVYGSVSPFKYIVIDKLREIEKAKVFNGNGMFEQKIKIETVFSKRLDRRPLITFEDLNYSVNLSLSVSTDDSIRNQKRLVAQGGESFKDISGKSVIGSVFCVLFTQPLEKRHEALNEWRKSKDLTLPKPIFY